LCSSIREEQATGGWRSLYKKERHIFFNKNMMMCKIKSRIVSKKQLFFYRDKDIF